MKIYLAGPMRNIKHFNFPAFHSAAKTLRSWDYEVVSPAEHDLHKGFDPVGDDLNGTEDLEELGFDLVDSLLWDFKQVMTVDGIVLLPGWRNSRGANAELAVAYSVGTRVGYFNPTAANGPLSILSWAEQFKVGDKVPRTEVQMGRGGAVMHGGGGGGGVVSNPKDSIGEVKCPLHLVPAALDIFVAQAMKDGAEKYGPYNWREHPIQAHVYIAAIRRHLNAWYDGEDDAQDSGVNHLAHAAAGLGILLDALACNNLIDDRPTPGPSARLLKEQTSALSE